jgi:hypothetical protein
VLLVGSLAGGRIPARRLLGLTVSAVYQSHGQLLSNCVARQRAIERPQLGVETAGKRHLCGVERAASSERRCHVDHGWAVEQGMVGDGELFKGMPSARHVLLG